MYLEHFNLKELPFTLTPNTDYFCNLASHQNALNVVLLSLRNCEGFIKVVGEVGSGKTLLCRILLDKLHEEFTTAYIPNPDLTPDGLRSALALELGLQEPLPSSPHVLLQLINTRLLELYEQNKPAVLLIDEAQALSTECLETLRLLTNLETRKAKLLQIVLFGQPELNVKLNQQNLRQLKQRIGFSYVLMPMNRQELDAYLWHRLAKAGHTFGTLFNRRARNILHRKSQGIPRLVNILCHKALMVAYGRGEQQVKRDAMQIAAHDTEALSSLTPSKPKLFSRLMRILLVSGFFIICLLLAFQYYLLFFKYHIKF
jgi:MSHA biogenesis protein MshM